MNGKLNTQKVPTWTQPKRTNREFYTCSWCKTPGIPSAQKGSWLPMWHFRCNAGTPESFIISLTDLKKTQSCNHRNMNVPVDILYYYIKKKKKNEAVFAASTAWHSKKLCSYLIAVVIHSPLRSSSPEISTITQHSFAPDPHPVKEGNTEIHHHALQNSRLKKTGGVSQYLPFVLQHWCIMQQAPRAGQWGQGKNGSILQPGAVGWELRMLPCWLFPPGGSNLTAAGLW